MNIFIIIVVGVIVWLVKGHVDKKKEIAFLRAEAKSKEDARLKKSALPTLKILRDALAKPYDEKDGVPYVSIDDWNDLFGRTPHREESFLKEIGITNEELECLKKEYQVRQRFFGITCNINCSRTEGEFEKAVSDREELLVENNKALADFGIDHDTTEGLRKKFFRELLNNKMRQAFYAVAKAQDILLSLTKARLELGLGDDDCGLSEVRNRLSKLSEEVK